MQSYDFLMLAVVIGCMVFGAWKGMAWQVASLASIVVSYFAAVNFSGAIAPMISIMKSPTLGLPSAPCISFINEPPLSSNNANATALQK